MFNPQYLRWNCCRNDGDKFVRSNGTPAFELLLDGEDSYFFKLK